MDGMDPRHYLPAGMAALPVNSDGVPFDCSHVYASGNIAADMLANATAEASGRTLACRLFEMTDDPGMKEMWRFLIARDTMHQQQWLAVLEELGGLSSQLPIPNSFPQSQENREFSYVFLSSSLTDRRRQAGLRRGHRSTGSASSAPGRMFRSARSRPGAARPRRLCAKRTDESARERRGSG